MYEEYTIKKWAKTVFFCRNWAKKDEKFPKKQINSFPKSIDLNNNLQYNISMTKITWKTVFARVFFTLACVGVMAFIFYNSMQTAKASTSASNTVTDAVQKFVGVFAPNSWIATATGADYKILTEYIRTFAHFAEFGLLGALLVWCYFSYTKDGWGLIVPFGFVLYVPLVDECIQEFTYGRAGEVKDALVDTAGGLCGAIFAVIVTVIVFAIIKKRKKRKEQK